MRKTYGGDLLKAESWRGFFLGGKAHGETAKEKQHKAATRRLPLRTD